MDDLVQSLAWILPVLFGLLSWLAVQFREAKWGRAVAERLGFARGEHEQEWEFQRRLGSFWLTIATVVGVVTYMLGQRLMIQEGDAAQWEYMAVLFGALVFIWSTSNSIRAFWASRRDA